jgi:hypothetical protein
MHSDSLQRKDWVEDILKSVKLKKIAVLAVPAASTALYCRS